MHSVGALVYTGRCSTSAHSITNLCTPRDSQFRLNNNYLSAIGQYNDWPHTHTHTNKHCINNKS